MSQTKLRQQRYHGGLSCQEKEWQQSYFTNREPLSTTPSRLSRPAISIPASCASIASCRSTSATVPGYGPVASLKRARKTSPTKDTTSYVAPIIDTPPGHIPGEWAHVGTAIGGGSPPPMCNSNYFLRGGMDTPSISAERQYQDDISMGVVSNERMSRDTSHQFPGLDEPEEYWTGTERNGRARYLGQEDIELQPSGNQGSWSCLVWGALGHVVTGAFSFCRKAAFHGFYAGGGQGYDLKQHPNCDGLTNESVWEDEVTPPKQFSGNMFDQDNLSTPVPGEYPQDCPCPEIASSPQPVVKRRRQTDGGDWIVVDCKETWSRTTSPRLRTPVPNRPVNQRLRSASSKRPVLQVSRQCASSAIIDTPLQSYMTNTRSRGNQKSPCSASSRRFSLAGQLSSPTSAEALRFAAVKRRETKINEQRYDRLNDQLKIMIQQGKEALGSKFEIMLDDDEAW